MDEPGGGKGKDGKPARGRRIVLVAAVIVLLVAGGGWWLSNRSDGAQGAVPAEKQPEEVVVPVKELIVNLADASQRRYLKLKPVLAVDSREMELRAGDQEAQIRHTIIMLVRTKTVDDLSGPQGARILQQEICRALNEAIFDGQLRNVYFEELLIQ